MGKRILDVLIAVLCAAVGAICFFYFSGWSRGVGTALGGVFALVFLCLAFSKARPDPHQQPEEDMPPIPAGTITELALLNDNDQIIASWELYGKTGMVIGRDVGENSVTVNLNRCTYASLIEIEHAVLNYAAGNWYVEDLASKNGVSVVKSDGKKYRLAPDKPCLLSAGDILYIATTRLLIR